MRMDRRAGLLYSVKLPTLAELMADMTVICGGGPTTSTSTTTNKSIDISSYGVTYPYFLFISNGPASAIILRTSSGQTTIKSYGTLSVSATTSSISVSTASYGFAYMVVKFPSYTDSIVRQALSKMTLAYKGSRASTDAAANDVYFSYSSVVSNAVYISAAAGTSVGGRMSLSWGSDISEGPEPATIATRSVNNTPLAFSMLLKYSSTVYLCRSGTYGATSTNRIIYGGVYVLSE